MENQYRDDAYTSICSEKTLQSNGKGFFLAFANRVAEAVGETWIKNVFGKLKSDRERVRIVYEDKTVKDVLYDVLSHVQEIYRKKNSEVSKTRRIEAENLFKNGDSFKALALFSQSVLRAQKTGENKHVDSGISLALALWGRAQVLLEMNEFFYALTDIQLAFKEDLPETHKAEAFWKLAICYKAIGDEERAKVSFELAKRLLTDKTKIALLEEDKTNKFVEAKHSSEERVLPSVTAGVDGVLKNASKKLTVKESQDKGRYVVANMQINAGETIVVEPPYAACLLPECFGSHCHHCFERLTAPVGCPVCSNVAFCKPSCRDAALSSYHKYECKFLELLIGSGMSILSHTALRIITQKPLAETVEVYKDRSKDAAYLLCTLANMRPPNDFFQRTLMATFLLRCLQKSGFFGESIERDVPSEEEYQVCELLLFHLQMLQFNAHEIYETRHGPNHRFRGAKAAYIGVAVYPTVALFNHDCYPAVTRYFVGKNIVITAVRPLSPGEVVAENYGPIFTRKTLPERQRSLLSRYWFTCRCLACTENWPSLDTGLEEASRRIRCPNEQCSYKFTLPIQKELLSCPKCRKKVSLTEYILQLKSCEEGYRKAFEALEAQEPQKAVNLLKHAINTFHRVSSPPHRDTHLGQEILRACLADSGNVYECLVKL